MALAGVALLVGCGEESAYELSPAVVRLVDQLDEARVSTPLTEVLAPVGGVESSEIPTVTVVERTFEGETNSEVHGCRIVAAGAKRAGRAIRCTRRTTLLSAEVEASSHYRFRHSSRRESGRCTDFTLTEVGWDPTTSDPILVRVHSLQGPSTPRWQEYTFHFFTEPLTRSLSVELPKKESCGFFDDLVLERLQVTESQNLALLRDKLTAPDSDTTLGVAKHGRLMPVGQFTRTEPFDENYSVRDALFAPAPSDLVFDLQIPAGAVFRFSYGLALWSRLGDRADFSVSVELPGEAPRELFNETVEIGDQAQGWYWREASVDLSEFAGRQIALGLHTRTSTRRGYGLWGSPVIARPAADNEPPSIVLIAVDTLRADRLPGYGADDISTPALDRLAAEGVLFEQTIAQSNWTLPSFVSIFTGVLPSRHGAVTIRTALSSGFVTLTEYLRAAGWSTHAILYKAALQDIQLDQGFDRYFNHPRNLMTAEMSLHKARQWLSEHADSRFFLFLHFNDPHQPFSHSDEFLSDKSRATMEELGLELPWLVASKRASQVREPGGRGNKTRCRKCEKQNRLRPKVKELSIVLYGDEIEYVDDRIGQFLDDLRERDLYDNTIIAFVSDHGESYWEHGEVHGHGNKCPCYYDEQIRVPLIIKPASRTRFEKGKRVATQVRAFDLMPTLLEFAGLDPSALDIEAESLMPLILDNESAAGREDRLAIAESGKGGGMAARLGGWKYLRTPRIGGTGHTEHLYDLRADPDERNDLSSEEPRKLESLRTAVLETLLRDRGGRVLLITGGPEPRDYVIRLQGGTLGEVLFESLEPEKPRNASSYHGSSADSILLLAQLRSADGDLRVIVEAAPHDETESAAIIRLESTTSDLTAEPFRQGVLRRHLAERRLGIHVIRGPPRHRPAAARALDGARKETLEALGYIN